MNRDIIILLVMIVPTSMSCTYDLYEDALLNEENQANLYHIDSFIPNEDGDSIGFGFWSYSIPQWSPKVLVEIENMFNPTLQESGLFLFLIKSGLKNIALGYASGDYKKKLIYHNIVFFQDQNILKQFTFAPITYIANWILTSITYNLLNQEFIVVSNNVKYKQSFTLEQNSMTVYLGGRGFFNQNWNLNVFNGRLSKLFVRQFKESTFSLFDYMIQFCQVPKQNQEEQVVYLIKGLKQFSGDTLLMSTIKQFGNRYCLSGWVKYDFSKVIDETRYLVFRISSRQYYNKELYMGDEILKLEMNAALKQKAEYCNLILRRDEYILPSWGKINYRSNNFYSYIFSDIYHDFYYYNGLQIITKIKLYKYGSEVANKGLLIQFQFFNELGLVQQKAAIPGISDSLFYFFIGGDDFTKSQLDAQMFDFKFEYNYDQHKTIQLNVCHYSCLTCKGPLEDNCLTCSSSSNRNFVQEQNKCQCKYGYINQEGQQLCIQFNQMFPSVQMTETQMTEYAQCPQGYFFVPNQSNSNNCVICPQSNYGDFSCIDCYQQTESWYLKPKCTRDLISRKLLPQDGFYYKERNLIDYDLYCSKEFDIFNYDFKNKILARLSGMKYFTWKIQKIQLKLTKSDRRHLTQQIMTLWRKWILNTLIRTA